jgi:hypothetical protein
MGLLTLQDIFCAGYPEYARTHALPAHVRTAARAIMQCRTAALGGHIQPVPTATCRASGTTRAAIGPAPNVRFSRPSAGSSASRRACWRAIITTPSSPCRMRRC